jgi:hypothetical protein
MPSTHPVFSRKEKRSDRFNDSNISKYPIYLVGTTCHVTRKGLGIRGIQRKLITLNPKLPLKMGNVKVPLTPLATML